MSSLEEKKFDPKNLEKLNDPERLKILNPDLIWRTLFLENTPYSESCRGVLTTLSLLGLDVASSEFFKDGEAVDGVWQVDVEDGQIDAYREMLDIVVREGRACGIVTRDLVNGRIEAHAADAVVLATGNDWRAIEAGAHAYAARSGKYTSLSTWGKDADGNLVGTLEMPMAVGIVGGATRVHPAAQAAVKLMGVKTANELAEIIVSVGRGIKEADNIPVVEDLAKALGADECINYTTQDLAEERNRAEHLRERVADLEQQLAAQTKEAELLGQRSKDLEARLGEHVKLLTQSESELNHVRNDLLAARKAENDLRTAIAELHERTSAAFETLSADAITLTELTGRLAQFDIVVTCTASTLPIIGKGTLERVIRERPHVRSAEVGMGLHEMKGSLLQDDVDTFRPLVEWLERRSFSLVPLDEPVTVPAAAETTEAQSTPADVSAGTVPALLSV